MDFIKLDVEGIELEILGGMEREAPWRGGALPCLWRCGLGTTRPSAAGATSTTTVLRSGIEDTMEIQNYLIIPI